MVVSSSELTSPAVAVEREMVGRGAVGGAMPCCWLCMAWRACCAVRVSLDLGDEEKSWARRLPPDREGLRSALASG